MLSIIYITCNRSEELKKSILSCEDRVTIPHEYIIIDNGSVDDTDQIIEKMVSTGLPIRYFKQKINHGVSGGRNIGFNKAMGDICYFIDDDASIISEGLVLNHAYEYMLLDDSIHAMGTDCYDTERKCQLVGTPEKGHSINSESNIISYVGCSHFIRKTSITRDYLYPDNLVYGSEEAYASKMIYRAGGRVVQYPYLKVLHVPSTSTRSTREIRRRNGHINTYVIKRYFVPFPFNIISFVAFIFRILRFEQYNYKLSIDDYRQSVKRYDNEYVCKMTINQIIELIKKFGIRNII